MYNQRCDRMLIGFEGKIPLHRIRKMANFTFGKFNIREKCLENSLFFAFSKSKFSEYEIWHFPDSMKRDVTIDFCSTGI